MATKIIAVAIQKGGVGKTTTTISIAHGMAMRGKKVMIIDFDTQGQCATYLGLTQEPGVYNWLSFPLVNSDKTLTVDHIRQWVRLTNRDNLFILPGNQATALIPGMVSVNGTEIKGHFKRCLAPLAHAGLDYIVFDTPPSRGPVQEGAVWAADLVLIPAEMEYGSMEGISALTGIMRKFTEEGWKGKLAGILPTFFEGQIEGMDEGLPVVRGGTNDARDQYNDLVKHFGVQVVLPPIHYSVAFREAVADGKTIYEMNPKNEYAKRGQEEYERIVKDLLKLQ
jgi:chromosome partitioning protein